MSRRNFAPSTANASCMWAAVSPTSPATISQSSGRGLRACTAARLAAKPRWMSLMAQSFMGGPPAYRAIARYARGRGSTSSDPGARVLVAASGARDAGLRGLAGALEFERLRHAGDHARVGGEPLQQLLRVLGAQGGGPPPGGGLPPAAVAGGGGRAGRAPAHVRPRRDRAPGGGGAR